MSSKHTLEQIINKSKDVYRLSTLTQASLDLTADNRLASVTSTWSQRDFEKNQATSFQRSYIFDVNAAGDKAGPPPAFKTKPQAVRGEVWSVSSRDSLRKAVIVNWENASKEEQQFIEIWDRDNRLKNVNLTKLNKHGKIYENLTLGSFVWSADSTKIAYIAEKKNLATQKCLLTSKYETTPPKEETDSKPPSSKDDDLVTESNYEEKYANFSLDVWGERLSTKSQSVIAVYDLESDEIKVVENLPADYAPFKVTWYKNEGFVFAALHTKPYKLGVIYCPMRKSELFYYDLATKTCTQITDYKNQCIRDPVFSPDFEKVCWLQNQARGPHFQCSKLMMMDWKSRETTTLIDIVSGAEGDEFPGIFAAELDPKCWSVDSKRILITTAWRVTSKLICYHLDSKQVVKLDNKLDELDSIGLMDFSNDWICAFVKGFNKRAGIAVAKLPASGSESNIEWTFCEKPEPMDTSVEINKFEPTIPDPKYPKVTFQSILIQPKKDRNDVLVVFPHGGPHSNYVAGLYKDPMILNALGYSVLMINYRGSSGYGQDMVDCLPGRAGVIDVQDCQQAAEFAMKKYNFAKAVVFGGSHGGFLGAHLVGQYAHFYQAASLLNPVTHLESMFALSDIPDWVICEGTGNYDFEFGSIPTDQVYKQLYENSPTKYVDQVKTPVLLVVGKADLRVPPSQSYFYHKALLARSVPSRLLAFKDDSHPLDTPQTDADCIINTILWFEKHL